jgi:hypothetical protein
MINIFTDILMVFEFLREGKTKFAYVMLGSIIVNLGIQLLVVIGQNFKLGFRKVLREVLIVFICTKPGVDTFRVASETVEKGKRERSGCEKRRAKGLGLHFQTSIRLSNTLTRRFAPRQR